MFLDKRNYWGFAWVYKVQKSEHTGQGTRRNRQVPCCYRLVRAFACTDCVNRNRHSERDESRSSRLRGRRQRLGVSRQRPCHTRKCCARMSRLGSLKRSCFRKLCSSYYWTLTALDIGLTGDGISHCFELVTSLLGKAWFAELDVGVLLGTSVTLFLLLANTKSELDPVRDRKSHRSTESTGWPLPIRSG